MDRPIPPQRKNRDERKFYIDEGESLSNFLNRIATEHDLPKQVLLECPLVEDVEHCYECEGSSTWYLSYVPVNDEDDTDFNQKWGNYLYQLDNYRSSLARKVQDNERLVSYYKNEIRNLRSSISEVDNELLNGRTPPSR